MSGFFSSQATDASAVPIGGRFVGEQNTGADQDYDPRPLYERLEEQEKLREQGTFHYLDQPDIIAFLERTRLANRVKTLDADEIQFLQTWGQANRDKEQAIRNAEALEVLAFRSAKAKPLADPLLSDPSPSDVHQKLQKIARTNRNLDQKSIVLKGIKRKGQDHPKDANNVLDSDKTDTGSSSNVQQQKHSSPSNGKDSPLTKAPQVSSTAHHSTTTTTTTTTHPAKKLKNDTHKNTPTALLQVYKSSSEDSDSHASDDDDGDDAS